MLNRRELIQLASQIQERRAALQGEIAHPDTDSELAGAEVDRDVGELRLLDAALLRIADGSYGICSDCGADLPLERLRAEPAAARCVACQQRHEKTFRS